MPRSSGLAVGSGFERDSLAVRGESERRRERGMRRNFIGGQLCKWAGR